MKAPDVTYRERLLPSIWVYLVVLALIAMLAVAVGAAYLAIYGWLAFIGLSALCIAGLTFGSPVITVSDQVLGVGRAQIAREFLGGIQVLDGDQMRAAQHVAERFMVLRPWHARGGVLIALTDAADPHPGWLLTTNNPTGLAVALMPAASIG
jgi:hypothetical protein